jgi:arylsulfatase A-like enzyme
MNFVVIMCDTLRADHLGCYGNKWIHTPNLDRFAAGAMLFERAYCASWPTIPNRTDLFTGRFGEPLHPWLPLSWEAVTLPELMRANGYVSQLIHDTPHLINHGFGFDRPFHAWWMIRGNEVDRYLTDAGPVELPCSPNKTMPISFFTQYLRNVRGRRLEQDYFAPRVFQAAAEWLERNRDHEKFFLWIDSFDPHEPWDPPRRYTELYDPGYEGEEVTAFFRLDQITPRELKHIRALYAGEVTMVDRWLGVFLNRLEELGLAKNTVVVVVSDHGTGLGDHINISKTVPCFEEVARIVWLLKHPEGLGAGKRSQALAQPADLMPTLLELAGIPAPEGLQGRSLVPLLHGKTARLREIAVTGSAPAPWHCGPLTVTDDRWALFDSPDRSQWHLFDLKSDPRQTSNVLAENRPEAERLHARLLEFLRQQGASPEIVSWYEVGPPASRPEVPPSLRCYEARGLRVQNLLASEVAPPRPA